MTAPIYYLLPPDRTYLDIPNGHTFEALYPPEPHAIVEHQRSWRVVTLRVTVKQVPKIDPTPERYYVHVSTRVVSEDEARVIMEGEHV